VKQITQEHKEQALKEKKQAKATTELADQGNERMNAISASLNKCMMGMGMILVLDPTSQYKRLVANRPPIVDGADQRDLVFSHVNYFAGMGLQGLRTDSPVDALTILACKSWIVQNSITKSNAGPFPDIEFTDESKGHKLVCPDGTHRRTALEEILGTLTTEYEKLCDPQYTKTLSDDERAEGRIRRMELEKILTKQGRWLVVVYDRGKHSLTNW
jgi:hypothetical protein